jgi:hypothetical protein
MEIELGVVGGRRWSGLGMVAWSCLQGSVTLLVLTAAAADPLHPSHLHLFILIFIQVARSPFLSNFCC